MIAPRFERSMLFAVVVFAYSAVASAVAINFDTTPAGGPVAPGTVVDSLYASQGVTFSHEGVACLAGVGVYANDSRIGGFGSPPNVVSTCPEGVGADINDKDYGVIHASFAQPATQVCVDVGPDRASDFATLRVFDAADTQIGSGSSALGVRQTLCVNGGGIRGARFAGGSATAFASFDNFSVTFAGVPPAGTNYQGLWWAAGGMESGWGINFAHQGDQIFATWYTYTTTGRPWWLSMLATKTGGTSYAGPILMTIGSPYDTEPFPPVTSPSAHVGDGTLTFSDADHGSFDYTVNGIHQIKNIARFDMGTGPQPTCTWSSTTPDFAAATNYQDLWWVANGAESGWGINLAHQGSSVFATWYTYAGDGSPIWLSALALRVGASNVYTGPLIATSGPRFDAYDEKIVFPRVVGKATLTFKNGNSATFEYSTDGTAGFPVVPKQDKEIVRFPFGAAGGTICQ
jgi:hypothetical protein